MGDTLIDEEEPVPKTLSDPPPAPGQGEEAASEARPAAAPEAPKGAATTGAIAPLGSPPKRGRRRAILIALAAFVALLLASAAGVYVVLFRYEAVARRHVPGNANIAARFDFVSILAFAPVRDHLWPLVAGGTAGGSSRLEKIRDATGVDLATDGRELVVASADGSSFVAILGGRIARGRFVQGLAKVARDEAWAGYHLEGELLMGPGGIAIAQADDGAILVASNAATANAALSASDDAKRLGLPEDAPASFVITRDAWSGASSVLGAVAEHAPAFGRVERASGKLSLGSSPELSARIEPRQGQNAKAVASDIETTLTALRLLTLLLPDVAGEKSALGQAQVTVTPDGASVSVTAPWPIEGLDKGCSRLAGIWKVLGH